MAINEQQLRIKLEAAGIATTKAQFKSLSHQLNATQKSVAGMAGAIAMATAGLYVASRAIGSVIRTGKEFEQSMANVKAISGATGNEFRELEKNAKDLGATTVWTASQVSELQTEFAKLGFTADEIKGVTADTLALASAVGSDLATSAAVAGTTLRGFGLSVSETSVVTDTMALSFSRSALDMDKFRDSMSYVAPIAKMAGFSMEETTAVLGTLANSGISGSMAGTALRRIFLELSNESSKLTKRLGGPIKTMDELIPAMEKLEKEGIGTAEMKDLVGQRAVSAFSILKSGTKTLKELTEEFRNSGGAAQEMADIQLDTLQGKLTLAKSAMDGLKITMFEMSSGELVDLTEGFTSFISSIDEEDIKAYTASVKLLVGGFITYKGVVIAAKVATDGFTMSLTKTGIGVIAVGVGILTAEFIKMTGVMKDVTGGLADEEAQFLSLMGVLQRNIDNENIRLSVIKEIKKEHPEMVDGIDLEKASLEELATVIDDAKKSYKELIRVRATEEQEKEFIAEGIRLTKLLIQAEIELDKVGKTTLQDRKNGFREVETAAFRNFKSIQRQLKEAQGDYEEFKQRLGEAITTGGVDGGGEVEIDIAWNEQGAEESFDEFWERVNVKAKPQKGMMQGWVPAPPPELLNEALKVLDEYYAKTEKMQVDSFEVQREALIAAKNTEFNNIDWYDGKEADKQAEINEINKFINEQKYKSELDALDKFYTDKENVNKTRLDLEQEQLIEYATKAYTNEDELKKAIADITAEYNRQRTQQLEEGLSKESERNLQATLDRITAEEEKYIKLAEATNAGEEKLDEIRQIFQEKRDETEAEWNETNLMTLEDQIKNQMSLYSGMTSAMKSELDQRINNELKELKASDSYQKASAESRETLEEGVRKKYAKEQKRIFYMEQASKLASVYFSTADAVMKAMAGSTFTGGMPWTGMATAMGAVQAGLILSQKPPEYATGGLIGGNLHSQGGTPIIAERGEFVMQRRAVEDIGLEAMNRINEGSEMGNNITVNVSGNVMTQDFVETDLAEAIREASRKGTSFGA